MTAEEEKEEETVLALLREYATAQEEVGRAEAALIAFMANGTRDRGWASLVHRQFLAEDRVVAAKNAARKAWAAYHPKKKA